MARRRVWRPPPAWRLHVLMVLVMVATFGAGVVVGVSSVDAPPRPAPSPVPVVPGACVQAMAHIEAVLDLSNEALGTMPNVLDAIAANDEAGLRTAIETTERITDELNHITPRYMRARTACFAAELQTSP